LTFFNFTLAPIRQEARTTKKTTKNGMPEPIEPVPEQRFRRQQEVLGRRIERPQEREMLLQDFEQNRPRGLWVRLHRRKNLRP
jgi:hypothetical protein